MGLFDFLKGKKNKQIQVNQEKDSKAEMEDFDITIDSSSQLQKLGSEVQTITLAKNLPEFKLSEFQDEFEECLFNNDFLQSYQNLEKKAYYKGLMAIGLVYEKEFENSEDFKYSPTFRYGNVISYKIEKFKLVELIVQIDTFNANYMKYSIIEEYSLKNQKDQNFIKAYAMSNGKKYEFSQIDYSYQKRPNIYSFIPFILFPNRFDEKDDFTALLNEEYIAALNIDLEIFIRDGFLSAPYIFINGKTAQSQKELQDSVYDLTKRIIKSNAANMILQDDLIKQLQATSQGQIIIQKINHIMKSIKDFAFMKKSTQNLGTKNVNSGEIQDINSDFDGYIETKANLREIVFKKFVMLWIKVLQHHEVITKDKKIKIEVIVNGSTKYLQKQAEIVKTTQDGKIINPLLAQIKNEKENENIIGNENESK